MVRCGSSVMTFFSFKEEALLGVVRQTKVERQTWNKVRSRELVPFRVSLAPGRLKVCCQYFSGQDFFRKEFLAAPATYAVDALRLHGGAHAGG